MDSSLAIIHSRIAERLRTLSEDVTLAFTEKLQHDELELRYACLDRCMDQLKAQTKEDLDEARQINAFGPFAFLRLPKELRLAVYDEHFRGYGTHVELQSSTSRDSDSESAVEAGINLVRTCKEIHAEALPRLVRNAKFIIDWMGWYRSKEPDPEAYSPLVISDRLSHVGSTVANLIETLDIYLDIDLRGVAWDTMDWRGLGTMKNLKLLAVEVRLGDDKQELWCSQHYEDSPLLKGLVEGLVRALPAACALDWFDQGQGTFYPEDIHSLRQRINPYQGPFPARRKWGNALTY